MNILIATLGSHGDVHPFLGIGRELRARGHDVTLIAGAIYEPLARGLGLDFAPIGTAEEFKNLLKDKRLWHPTRGFAAIADAVSQATPKYYDAIVERHVPGRTIVVMSSLALGARVAQEKLGFPMATVHLSPAIFRTLHDVPRLGPLPLRTWHPRWVKKAVYGAIDRFVVDAAFCPALNALRKQLNLPPARGIMRQWWNSPDRVIGLFPDWFGPPQPDWPEQARCVGFPLYDESDQTPVDDAAARFLDGGESPILFTPGSAMLHGAEFFAAAVAACRRLGRRGMLLTRHPEQIPADLPETVKHFAFVPFSKVLPRSAALVHHGGIGTMSQALAAGVPQIVMPMSHDQPDNAERARKLGVAEVVPANRFNAKTLTAALKKLLESPTVPQACRSVAGRFKNADALSQAATLVEALSPATGIQIDSTKPIESTRVSVAAT